MMIMITAMLVTLTFTNILMMISNNLSKKTFSDREKNSPYECGFDPKSSSRLPFSIQFFLIAVIFLIFDVEIALLMPMITSMKLTNLKTWTTTSTLFILILILGTLHEWNQGALDWAN
uniref:NADH-ubiquinone oxidoreductase chain 3 n=1 Tax=Tetraphalerus bruchi TaxID=546504 RepID=B6D8Y9_TETBR|nr:NADH dehydrogenase subunit 3 [Tetraphalerus bruchi]ACF35127.1 NADH dehydrogenase subunit 3 [Tetraphalerus bruchi]